MPIYFPSNFDFVRGHRNCSNGGSHNSFQGCLEIKQFDAISEFTRVEVVVTKYTHAIPEITATKFEEEFACIDISAPEQMLMSWMTGPNSSRRCHGTPTRGPQNDQDLPLGNFEVDLNTFDVKIDNLMSSVEFESSDPSSSTGSFRVMVYSIILKNTEPNKAASLNINVMSGGKFFADQRLYLTKQPDRTAKAELITLFSDLDSGGNFSPKASSDTGTAFCATIHMETSCNSGTSKAVLPSTYEGSFDVRTSIGRPSFDSGNPNELDPQELNRRRQVQFRRNVDRFPIGGEGSGWVFWSRDGKQRGSAEHYLAVSWVRQNVIQTTLYIILHVYFAKRSNSLG
ncbi:hypothetical protein K435DRAFT_813753 [Dendrothele bispora CBS 962.96]|uniref:Uncharacterized protein n=1 Tax=Dendrothele bispora (strain CBS 962.96) TaxID=1314807 RepID=A0A4S8KKZ0_DENBC|nr:hypothetical protein K435DRAFT_813753 [Dendrothele bispora CBS 962.96]